MGMPCGRKYPHPLRPLACSAAFHLGAEGEGPRARPGARAARVVLRVVAELAALAIAARAAGHELPAHLGPQLGRLAARAAHLACAHCHSASDNARACAAQADAGGARRHSATLAVTCLHTFDNATVTGRLMLKSTDRIALKHQQHHRPASLNRKEAHDLRPIIACECYNQRTCRCDSNVFSGPCHTPHACQAHRPGAAAAPRAAAGP